MCKPASDSSVPPASTHAPFLDQARTGKCLLRPPCLYLPLSLHARPSICSSAGVNRLRLTKISAAAAEQRSGRAGRTGPGVCLRLWDQDERLLESTPPEIEEADLAPLVLELSLWCVW